MVHATRLGVTGVVGASAVVVAIPGRERTSSGGHASINSACIAIITLATYVLVHAHSVGARILCALVVVITVLWFVLAAKLKVTVVISAWVTVW